MNEIVVEPFLPENISVGLSMQAIPLVTFRIKLLDSNAEIKGVLLNSTVTEAICS
jgi:hypothetical protein